MTITTEYGTWVNHGDRSNTTVEATIADAINGGDANWREAMESTGALDLIASAYREAINAALPYGVSLAGNDFYGPYYESDQDFDGYPTNEDGALDITTIIEGVDLYAIVERYDIPGAVEAAVAAADESDSAAKLATGAAAKRAAAVLRVVEACGGNQSLAARLLNIDQSTVNKLIRKERTAAVNRAIFSVPLLQNPGDEQAQEMVKRAIAAQDS